MENTFEIWENLVNDYMIHEYGLGIDDIPDMPWYEWWTDELEAEEAGDMAIRKCIDEVIV